MKKGKNKKKKFKFKLRKFNREDPNIPMTPEDFIARSRSVIGVDKNKRKKKRKNGKG